ncbi:hypothetical protein FHS16_003100 [Paenibacillus endophyticus]|uniref:Copper amine oxidase-like N-terminal domain-containing protein n=1 Tax=Paenibacillus endophyticus TaxID=1294268 RepID=A0A7W5GAR1_9BACL|nr:copper amine oxidase N-terminal domain-containing protein [Paenibacillus endophyticus]MBB3153041.1 hypothetical protein [Paenibacillus endophyticus]
MRNIIISGILATGLLLSPISAHAAITKLDGGKLIAGRVFVPIRETGVTLGAKINWDSKTKTASLEKDEKKLIAKVGPFVKLIDGRVYVQLREVSSIFFANDPFGWDSATLTAGNSNLMSSVAPLQTSEALKITSNAISKKKEWVHLLEKADNEELSGSLTWDGLDTFKVVYSVEWHVYEAYTTGTIEVKMKKSGSKWIPSSFNYRESWGVIMP